VILEPFDLHAAFDRVLDRFLTAALDLDDIPAFVAGRRRLGFAFLRDRRFGGRGRRCSAGALAFLGVRRGSLSVARLGSLPFLTRLFLVHGMFIKGGCFFRH